MRTRSLKEGAGRCKSKQHKKVYNAIKIAFPNYRIYNEYAYERITETKEFRALRADIFIKDLDLVIEVNGEQHYQPVAFGGSPEEAKAAFKRQLVNDYNKRYLAEKYDFYLIELPYDTHTPSGIEWLDIISAVKLSKYRTFRLTLFIPVGYIAIPIDLEGNEIEDRQ